jgi:hypothetical protein
MEVATIAVCEANHERGLDGIPIDFVLEFWRRSFDRRSDRCDTQLTIPAHLATGGIAFAGKPVKMATPDPLRWCRVQLRSIRVELR